MSGWRAGWDRHPRWRKTTAKVLAVLTVITPLSGVISGRPDWWIPLFIFGIGTAATVMPDNKQ